MNRQIRFLLTTVFASALGVSCFVEKDANNESGANTDSAARPKLYVVNYPLKYFAERIAGDLADVALPVPKDVDPAFWMPDTETIGEYQEADLILLNGAGYAKWIQIVSLPLSLRDIFKLFFKIVPLSHLEIVIGTFSTKSAGEGTAPRGMDQWDEHIVKKFVHHSLKIGRTDLF